MFSKLFSSTILYVTITAEKVTLINCSNNKQISDKPILAITKDEKQRIVAVGSDADESVRHDPQLKLINGFAHPRSILNDFYAAEKTLQHLMKQLFVFTLLRPSLIIILHPLDKIEGGLTGIEVRALKELGAGCGARSVFIWYGSKLTAHHITSGSLPSGEWLDGIPDWIKSG